MLSLLAGLLLLLLPGAALHAERGVIDDSDGFTYLRAAQSATSAVMALVNAGEVFEFSAGTERTTPPAWLKVKLRNGKTGWMDHSRIRFHFEPSDLKDGGPTDEVNQDKWKGFAYYPTARLAAKGDPKALHTFFRYRGDGAAGEAHEFMANIVLHLAGDDRMAAFASTQSPTSRKDLREFLRDGASLWPFEPKEYLRLHFPKTSAALARR
ncbi:hypothetical protein CfE428DRAFT_3149 [Chthoniobacter flavus Ellin428]|uniref:SH3b domain-containing protein n=1 Tax=Chthoniobacter flavus Ellin428 TaxID=497964 RepID=B4D2M4_9BACT|nr:SH3 domain-containing protein [Chthoniobacter flavus]EDY19464.1 hypothetical protein CfE428DRAFT_3149 [Chthoniobacter flavus Ellin428]TCO90410.1 hypothetical protein EV701_11033 [Chthoniobacter flavus]